LVFGVVLVAVVRGQPGGLQVRYRRLFPMLAAGVERHRRVLALRGDPQAVLGPKLKGARFGKGMKEINK
jgi:hypothetical protein